MTSQTPLSLKKGLAFSLAVIVPRLLMHEGICRQVWVVPDYRKFRRSLPIAIQSPEAFHERHDVDLGWEHVPGVEINDFYGPGRNITINGDGFRGHDEYLGKKPSDQFRLVLLGDSFTLGYGVDDAETYSTHPGHAGIAFRPVQPAFLIAFSSTTFAREPRRPQTRLPLFH